jgi:ferredoxin
MAAIKFKVFIEGDPMPVFDDRGEGVLRAMERAGRAEIPVGCRNGGCGACKVLVLNGKYRLGKISRLHITKFEEHEGYALACRLYPETDIEVWPVGSLLHRAPG